MTTTELTCPGSWNLQQAVAGIYECIFGGKTSTDFGINSQFPSNP